MANLWLVMAGLLGNTRITKLTPDLEREEAGKALTQKLTSMLDPDNVRRFLHDRRGQGGGGGERFTKEPGETSFFPLGADSLLQRVTAAAEQRQLASHTPTRLSSHLAQGDRLGEGRRPRSGNAPRRQGRGFYEWINKSPSASHHLQVKASLALLYRVLSAPNPFIDCQAPRFQIDKTELRYHTSAQLAGLLLTIREERRNCLGRLTYHLAQALLRTGCRFHEWVNLPADRLVREHDGNCIGARLQGEMRRVWATPFRSQRQVLL